MSSSKRNSYKNSKICDVALNKNTLLKDNAMGFLKYFSPLFVFLLFIVNSAYSQTITTSGVTYTVAGNYSLVIPDHVTSIDIHCWGGGGGGKDGTNLDGGGGGGGGAYASVRSFSVTPGQTLTITVGAGGGVSTAGGASYVSTTTTAPASTAQGARAVGGSGATTGTGADGGSAASCIGTFTLSGGKGGNFGSWGSYDNGGGGGSSPGYDNAGVNAPAAPGTQWATGGVPGEAPVGGARGGSGSGNQQYYDFAVCYARDGAVGGGGGGGRGYTKAALGQTQTGSGGVGKVEISYYTKSFGNDASWTVPVGATAVAVHAWGAGGAGGGSQGENSAGSGGGGGAYAYKLVSVTPDEVYNITIGAAGVGASDADGGPGGDSFFKTAADVTVVAADGGAGGARRLGTAGAGGLIANCTGDIKVAGGAGRAGIMAGSWECAGAGGSSAGWGATLLGETGGQGGAHIVYGTRGTGGIGGAPPAGGTAGADAWYASTRATAPSKGDAGGGGGAGGSRDLSKVGGNGGKGKVMLDWGPVYTLGSDPISANANVAAPNANYPIHKFTIKTDNYNTPGTFSLTTVNFTTTGDYTTDDVTLFKLYYSATDDFTAATSIGTLATSTQGAKSFTGLTQTFTSNATFYFWIVADISSTALERNIAVSAMTNTAVTVKQSGIRLDGNLAGTATASGTQTFNTNFTATLASGNPASTAISPCNSSTKNVLYKFTQYVNNGAGTATLTALSFNTTGTFAAADISKYQLWYHTSDDISSATKIADDLTPTGGTGTTETFASVSQVLAASATSYFYITADIAASPTAGNTIIVSALTTNSFVISGGGLESGSASAGDTTTINTDLAGNTTASSAQSICTGSTPLGLTATAASGGSGSYTYVWQQSTTSSTLGFVSAIETSSATVTYTAGALTATTWYRRVTNSSTACAVTSNTSTAVQITVEENIGGNTTASAAQTICTGYSPAGLTATAATNGSGVYTYAWQESTTNSTTGFGAASETNDASGYSPGLLTTTTWYRRVVSSGACASHTSTAVGITVEADIGSNTVSGAQYICTSDAPSSLTGSAPSGGSGSYTYLWEESTDNATFGDASGTNTTQNYSPGVLTQDTWYRRRVSSGECADNTSTSAKVTVLQNTGTLYYWKGTTSNNWATAGNWCSGVPTSSTDVVIPSGTVHSPVIEADGAVCKDITINTGATLTMNTTYSLGVYGNWDNQGTFTPASSAVHFTGTTDQSIDGSGTQTFYNLTINNTGTSGNDDITLLQPVTVSNQLALTDGIVVSNSTEILTLSNTATTATNGGNADSFVRGPIRWNDINGAGPFIFPTGKANKWARVALSGITDPSAFVCEYYNTPYTNIATPYLATTGSNTLTNVSANEYWDVNLVSGTGSATVTLYWENAAQAGITSCVDDGNLVVAHYRSDNLWYNENSSGQVTIGGSCVGTDGGSVTSGLISTFSPHTFGNINIGVNPLPIQLLSFTAVYNGKSVDIKWSTASEINNDYFTIERSTDGIHFEEVAVIFSKAFNGNSSSTLFYYFNDDFNTGGVYYYRLKQNDYDGQFAYSAIVSVIISAETTFSFKVAPNPNNGHEIKLIINAKAGEQITVNTYDALGQYIHTQQVVMDTDGENIYYSTMPFGLRAGVYFFNATSEYNHAVTVNVVVN